MDRHEPLSSLDRLEQYPLMQAILGRRSRRFGRGMSIGEGAAWVAGPADRTVTRIEPFSPRFERTISSASPLNAFRWSAWNGSTVAALPLSTAAITPGHHVRRAEKKTTVPTSSSGAR